MPVPYWRTHTLGPLSVAYVEVVALVGLVAGWVLFDRLNAMRSPAGWAALAGVGIAVGGWVVCAWLGLGPGVATVLAISFGFGGIVRGRELAPQCDLIGGDRGGGHVAHV